MLTAIKGYAVLALLFPACWAVIGYRLNKRRELAAIKAEYRWHMSPMILGELDPVIRAEDR